MGRKPGEEDWGSGMITFAIIGVAGYVAPRHIQAIKDVGGELVAALDPHDSVGILDQYFPGCLYFREPERFDRWLSKNQVDYVVVCSPNYLHDAHCLMAMRNGADVICEKPLVLNERNLDNLLEWEVKTGGKVNVILQCRLHPEVVKAKVKLVPGRSYSLNVDYCTPRGAWYQSSWKGDVEKSGGLISNIGIHLFDLAFHLLGHSMKFSVTHKSSEEIKGCAILSDAVMDWHLSTEMSKEPKRLFKIDDIDIDLTNGFADLHTKSYQRVLDGHGFCIEDIRLATRITEAIRNAG